MPGRLSISSASGLPCRSTVWRMLRVRRMAAAPWVGCSAGKGMCRGAGRWCGNMWARSLLPPGERHRLCWQPQVAHVGDVDDVFVCWVHLERVTIAAPALALALHQFVPGDQVVPAGAVVRRAADGQALDVVCLGEHLHQEVPAAPDLDHARRPRWPYFRLNAHQVSR